jgi:hypothetical protein
MTIVSIFFIVLIAAFAVVALITEPSQTDKLVHARLVSLDRRTDLSENCDVAGHRETGYVQHHPGI